MSTMNQDQSNQISSPAFLQGGPYQYAVFVNSEIPPSFFCILYNPTQFNRH